MNTSMTSKLSNLIKRQFTYLKQKSIAFWQWPSKTQGSLTLGFWFLLLVLLFYVWDGFNGGCSPWLSSNLYLIFGGIYTFIFILWLLIEIGEFKFNVYIRRVVAKRTILLMLTAYFGFALAIWWHIGGGCVPLDFVNKPTQLSEMLGISDATKGQWLNSSLSTLFLTLPTLLALWVFRTHDTREQIEKTKEQIEITKEQIEKTRINTLTSQLTHGLDMITSNEFRRRYAGFIQLGQLKKQTDNFNAQIDFATRYIDLRAVDLDGKPASEEQILVSLDCQRALLMKAPLKGMDLSGAKLRGANLKFADLAGADLTDADLAIADLTSADLTNTDLTYANLIGADLSDANWKGAIFNHAIYSEDTKFPKGFNPEAEGAILFDDLDVL